MLSRRGSSWAGAGRWEQLLQRGHQHPARWFGRAHTAIDRDRHLDGVVRSDPPFERRIAPQSAAARLDGHRGCGNAELKAFPEGDDQDAPDASHE